MKKKFLSIGAAGFALIAITGSAFATTTTTNTAASTTTKQAATAHHQHKGKFDNQALLTLLGIDANTLQQDLEAGQSIADIAKAQGKTEQDVIDLFVQQSNTRLDQAVQSGKLTQDQADQMKTKQQDSIKKRVEQKGENGFHGKRGGQGGSLQDAASFLGVNQTDLMTQLKAGKTLAQIAQDKGVSEQDLIDQLLQKDKARLTKMVEQTWQLKDKKVANDTAASSDSNSTGTSTNTENSTAAE